MNAFLVAFAPYFPWIVALIAILLLRRAIIDLLRVLRERLSKVVRLEFDSKGTFALITDTEEAKVAGAASGEPVEVFGDPDRLKLIFKVQSRTWKKSTKAMEIAGGCLVQMSTDRLRRDGSWESSETMSFVSGARIIAGEGGAGHELR